MKQVISFKQGLFMMLMLLACIFFQGCQKGNMDVPTAASDGTLTNQQIEQASTRSSIGCNRIDNIIDNIKMPNLTIKFIHGTGTTISFEVANIGEAKSGSCVLGFLAGAAVGSILGMYRVPELPPSATVKYTYTPAFRDMLTLKVDYNKSVAESDEKDNTLSVTLDDATGHYMKMPKPILDDADADG